MQLHDIAAIVTGGASGLGAAAARALAAEGAKVAVFDLNAEAGAALAAEIGGVFVSANVTDDAGVAAALAAAESVHGVARVLVNCAGVAPGMRVVGKDGTPHALDAFRRAVEINLVGTFNVLSKAAARMLTLEPIGEERGVIVNTASVAAFDGQIGQAAYAASKGGVAGMTLPLARDLAQHKIRVMTIAPGVFETPMVQGFSQAVQDSLGAQVPHPSRLGKPAEYARLALAIIANPMLNGETIRLDGAIRMGPK
jgi:NAD(P)-dependent dehydrogenase (short-subunit alcohol dehydrogenase family)